MAGQRNTRILRRARRGLGPSKLEAMEKVWEKGLIIMQPRNGPIGLFRMGDVENMFAQQMQQYDNLPREMRDYFKQKG